MYLQNNLSGTTPVVRDALNTVLAFTLCDVSNVVMLQDPGGGINISSGVKTMKTNTKLRFQVVRQVPVKSTCGIHLIRDLSVAVPLLTPRGSS